MVTDSGRFVGYGIAAAKRIGTSPMHVEEKGTAAHRTAAPEQLANERKGAQKQG